MITIDTREHKLIELIKNTSSFTIPYEIKNLQLGDIIITPSKSPNKSLIIERKCMTDMIASIKDGRYKEQKIRLQAEIVNNSNTLFCYLLEGMTNDLRLPNDKIVLYGSIISSMFRDKIPLIRTLSLSETLDMIIRLYERMNKNINDFFSLKKVINSNHTPEHNIQNNSNVNIISNSNLSIIDNSNVSIIPNSNISIVANNNLDTNNVDTNNLYLQSIKKNKKENITPKLWNQMILTNIPGISNTIAIKINEEYPTINSLLKAYTNCIDDDTRIKLLANIILTNTEKQKRRIGNVISKRIFEYLYLDN